MEYRLKLSYDLLVLELSCDLKAPEDVATILAVEVVGSLPGFADVVVKCPCHLHQRTELDVFGDGIVEVDCPDEGAEGVLVVVVLPVARIASAIVAAITPVEFSLVAQGQLFDSWDCIVVGCEDLGIPDIIFVIASNPDTGFEEESRGQFQRQFTVLFPAVVEDIACALGIVRRV